MDSECACLHDDSQFIIICYIHQSYKNKCPDKVTGKRLAKSLFYVRQWWNFKHVDWIFNVRFAFDKLRNIKKLVEHVVGRLASEFRSIGRSGMIKLSNIESSEVQ